MAETPAALLVGARPRKHISNGLLNANDTSFLVVRLYMQCRARAPVQAIGHIWISDELLSEAFNRFLRVSQSHRRHGSSVPGPLEAKRRLGKRRLGLEAASRGGSSPGFDFGALFGSRVKAPTSSEQAWIWEAPQAHVPRLSPAEDLPPWPWPPAESDRPELAADPILEEEKTAEIHDVAQVPPNIVDISELDTPKLDKPQDPIKESRVAFETLLQAQSHSESIEENDLSSLLEFLQSSKNEPEARLTLRLVQWLVARSHGHGCLRLVGETIQMMIRDEATNSLDTISDLEVAEVIFALTQQQDTSSIVSSVVVNMLDIMSLPMYGRVAQSVTNMILEQDTKRSKRRKHTENWLTCLRAISASGRNHKITWDAVYTRLRKMFHPSDLAHHFRNIPGRDFAQVMLKYWVPIYAGYSEIDLPDPLRPLLPHARLDASDSSEMLQYASSKPLLATSGWHKRLRQINWRHLATELEVSQQRPMEWVGDHHERAWSPILHLVSILATHKIPYAELLSHLFSIWLQERSPSSVRNVWWLLHDQPHIHVPLSFSVAITQRLLSGGNVALAHTIFMLAPEIPLMSCADLPLKMIEDGTFHGQRVFEVLNRRVGEDTVPFFERERFKQPLTQQHVDLVHLAAYAWARSRHVNARTALRRVWECYHFLQDRGAPLSPLLSRSFVRAGISQTLREGRALSKVKVRYILSIVRTIEGPEIAEQLDYLVFQCWQKGKRTPRTQQLGQAYHNDTSDMALAARWKMKLWVKRHSQAKAAINEDSSVFRPRQKREPHSRRHHKGSPNPSSALFKGGQSRHVTAGGRRLTIRELRFHVYWASQLAFINPLTDVHDGRDVRLHLRKQSRQLAPKSGQTDAVLKTSGPVRHADDGLQRTDSTAQEQDTTLLTDTFYLPFHGKEVPDSCHSTEAAEATGDHERAVDGLETLHFTPFQ